jgi:hypothetical protein
VEALGQVQNQLPKGAVVRNIQVRTRPNGDVDIDLDVDLPNDVVC